MQVLTISHLVKVNGYLYRSFFNELLVSVLLDPHPVAVNGTGTTDFEPNLTTRILPYIMLSFAALACSPVFAVDVETTADFIAISFEAEEFISKDDRWVMTDASTGQLPEAEDPDPNHSDTASGGVYFELLPDVRVTHADTFGPPTPFWGRGGDGPTMTWVIEVPEPGRYYIHARAYSTGTEDNGIHFGIDGTWPSTSSRMQFCTAGRRAWSWSSAQRDAGGVGSCGLQKTLFVDIEEAGPHTISASAREDGFELDRVVLIKDLSGNTRTCTPTTATGISCRSGGIDMADELTDLTVSLATTPETISDGSDEIGIGGTFSVLVVLENDDGFDNATDIVATAVFADGLSVTSASPECIIGVQTVSCTLADLEPTGPEENHIFEMNVLVLDNGGDVRSIDVSAENAVFEDELTNNVDSIDIAIAAEPLSTDVGLELNLQRDAGGNDQIWTVGDLGVLTVGLENVSEQNASTVNVALNLSSNVVIDLMPSVCVEADNIVCSLSNLDGGESIDLLFEISAGEPGTQLITATATTANDNNVSNDRDTAVVQFNAVPVTPIDTDESKDTDEGVDDVDSADSGIDSITSRSPRGGSGALGWQELLLLLLTLSAGVYWRHQRKPVPVRQSLRSQDRARDHRIVKHDH